MLNGSCRGFSNFYDRSAVQRSLAERLLGKSSNTGLSNGVIRNLLLVCIVEFGCSKGVFEEVANFVLSERSVEIPCFVVWFSLVIYGEIKRSIWFSHRFGTVTWSGSFVKFNWASWLCCLRALWVRRLSDDHHLVQYVVCCLFLTSTQGIRNQFLDQWPILRPPTQLTAFISSLPAKMKRTKPTQCPL